MGLRCVCGCNGSEAFILPRNTWATGFGQERPVINLPKAGSSKGQGISRWARLNNEGQDHAHRNKKHYNNGLPRKRITFSRIDLECHDFKGN